MNHSRVMQSGDTWFRGVPGVRSYDNNEWWLVRIGRGIEYACGVKFETIKLDRMVHLGWAGTSSLSEEIFGCMLRVSLEYPSRVLGYDTSIQYCLDSLSVPG